MKLLGVYLFMGYTVPYDIHAALYNVPLSYKTATVQLLVSYFPIPSSIYFL